jgi:hypothetical protein
MKLLEGWDPYPKVDTNCRQEATAAGDFAAEVIRLAERPAGRP